MGAKLVTRGNANLLPPWIRVYCIVTKQIKLGYHGICKKQYDFVSKYIRSLNWL